jgi:hypothetical protein
LIPGVTSRLRRALSEYGAANLLLYALQRAVQKVDRSAVIERQYIVSQPVPLSVHSSGRRGATIEVRTIHHDDPVLGTFTRIPAEIADRFAQKASCLGAFRNGELLGWLWFVPGTFRDFSHPVTFKLSPPEATTWDFDVYVRADARLSAAFSRLWEVAFASLRDLGVTQTLSAISAYNPASLRSHQRLGARALGSILILRVGRLQAVLSRRFRPHLQWSFRDNFRAALAINAPNV